ncbi:hypothetical protein HZC09_06565 [Candidatus Micrarchaeota archaeon]|nr:hypothetical protein [Candidatus Micrarchaeota archaeon]
MASLSRLEKEIALLKQRNRSVEADKAWETSWTRRFLLTVFTYVAVGAYLQAISLPNPWLNAIVPAVAFMLSTLTLPFFKKLWLESLHRQD